jgi:beta-phosphoglucomutase-like phosphatase (HAD superfamily)/dTDP-glucose pyrophosphorylase
MNKLIVFDLDGVLIDSKELHYEALNRALLDNGHPAISHDDHIKIFDGLPTKLKLEKLGVPSEKHRGISDRKQKYTVEMLEDNLKEDPKVIEIFQWVRNNGYQVHVASNSIKKTIVTILTKMGVIGLVDYIVSNEDVSAVKPHPEMYLKCMLVAGSGPRHTTIVEDSYFGREAAYQSGAHLLAVNNPDDLTLELIQGSLQKQDPMQHRTWKDTKMNVLIPMAGAGSRFSSAGYTFPKPLIEIQGKPMIQVVIENLKMEAHYIFVVQQEHYDKYNFKYLLNMLAPKCDIVCTSGVTEGAACTTLLAKDFIDNDSQLVIANSDQWMDWDSSEFLYAMQSPNVGGGIACFTSLHPKWSYVRENDLGYIVEVAEKKVISNAATTGIYYWKKGSDYVRHAKGMIAAGERVNNEYYVAPVYNRAIADGLLIKKYIVKNMMGLGTPEDLRSFLDAGIKI